MKNKDILFLAALNHFPKFGQNQLSKLSQFFSCWEEAFGSSLKSLIQAGIKENIALEFIKARHDIVPEKLAEQIFCENIALVEIKNKNYSKLLSEIYNPPTLLFCKGNVSLLNTICLSIVGTRKNTSYGQQACNKLCLDLIRNNFTIVSGLALGIDSIAHNIAVNNNGKTIAVLGSGINKTSIYPASNRYLADKIISNNGLIISEFSLGASPSRYSFPMRNRIISGLSIATLVIEAAQKSGALITAHYALEQNRDVFAVPGNIFSKTSIGANKLIKQGATPVNSAEEILETLDLKHFNSYIDNKKIIPKTLEEEKIIPHLNHEPIHIDELIRLSGLNAPELSSTLSMMEVRGIIKNYGGMKYALI